MLVRTLAKHDLIVVKVLGLHRNSFLNFSIPMPEVILIITVRSIENILLLVADELRLAEVEYYATMIMMNIWHLIGWR